jgi:hypothetical protein
VAVQEMITRRDFAAGAVAVLAAASVPVVANQLVRGVRYQSWPFGTQRPYYYWAGQCSSAEGLKPISYFMPHLFELMRVEPLWWEPLA